MGRRSFISMTQINRLISASNRRKRERQNEELIRAQGGNKKELAPEKSLISVEFDRNTRIAHILFQETQKYRTIERYITQNYVRYPIYSGWKTKSKTINRTLKLTNEKLENLLYDGDSLVRKFSKEIIASLNDETLYPSWFILHYLEEEYNEQIADIENQFLEFQKNKNREIASISQTISSCQSNIKNNDITIEKQKPTLNKTIQKLKKIENSKKSIIVSLLSFGIYAILNSNNRRKRIENKKNILSKIIEEHESKNKALSEEIKSLNSKIKILRMEINARYEEKR